MGELQESVEKQPGTPPGNCCRCIRDMVVSCPSSHRRFPNLGPLLYCTIFFFVRVVHSGFLASGVQEEMIRNKQITLTALPLSAFQSPKNFENKLEFYYKNFPVKLIKLW